MPGVNDKIIIDSDQIEGDFKALKHVGEQIEKYGLLKDAEPLREKLTKACYKFRETLEEIIREGEALINGKVIK